MFRQIHKEELKVPATTDYLGDLRDFITRIGKRYRLPDKVTNAFKLAIDEAGTNVMRHAYREFEGDGYITLRVLIRKNSLTLLLIDQGKYFDPQRVKDPDLDRYVQIGKRGGLGIFIIRKLMDEIDYRKTTEGNELRLTKYFEPTARTRLAQPLSSAVKAIPFSLKAKYWSRTMAVALGIVLLGYAVIYFRAEGVHTKEFLKTLREVNHRIAEVFKDQPTLLDDFTGGVVSAAFNTIYNSANTTERPFLHEIALVLPDGTIDGHNYFDKYYFLKLNQPTAEPENVADNILKYPITITNAENLQQEIEVYDLITEYRVPGKDLIKTLHIRANKSYLDAQIAATRWESGQVALYILLISAGAAVVLIYILLNPMRKLAEWVRRSEHGEIGDEMDIDSSTEVGEIAQAFTEITSKFRESQKSLVDKERLQQEMQVAKEIQQTLLPSDFPELEGYEIATHYEAAREVGGDYFDFVEVDKDTLGVVVADVSGKGVPGSLVMTMIRTALRTEARGIMDAAEVLARVNKFVVGDMKRGMFVTLFYVIIDSKRRRLNYASAGHNPMILYRPKTQKTYYLNPRGFPVGIQLNDDDLFTKSIESDTIQLAENDVLLIYTDGITEAMNSRRDLYGEERFLRIIREHGSLRVKPFVEMIKEELLSFTEGTAQSDDITLVAVKEQTTPEKEELRRAKEVHALIAAGTSIREACETVGITTYAYYNKYKKEFEEKGVENVEIDVSISVEAKHLSIEEKTKIFDIIKHNPEYGPKRISEELNSEKYDFVEIPENRIYDELVRLRLNTRQLREAFIERGDRNKRRIKPPGTPMLTLDGRVIISDQPEAPRKPRPERAKPAAMPEPAPSDDTAEPEETSGSPELPEEAAEAHELMAPSTASPAPPAEPEEIDLQKVFAEFFEPGAEDAFQDSAVIVSPGEETEAGETEEELIDLDVESLLAPATEPQTELEAPPPEELEDDALEATASFGDFFSSSSIVQSGAAEGDEPVDESDLPVEMADDLDVTAFIEVSAAPDSADENDEPLLPEATIAESSEAADDTEIDSLAAASTDDNLVQYESGATLVDDESFQDEIVSSLPESAIAESEEVADDTEIDSPAAVSVDDDLIQNKSGATQVNDEVPQDELILPSADQEINGDELDLSLVDEMIAADSDDFSFLASVSEILAENELDSSAGLPQEYDRTAVGPDGPAHVEEENGRQPYTGATAVFDEPEEDEREQLLITGLRYYKNRQFDQAIKEFQNAIVRYPNFKEAHSILGNAYFRNRMYDNAAAAYQRVKDLDPADTTAYENMGVIHANRGDYMEAMREWQTLLEIDSSRDDIRRKIELAARMMMKKSAG